MSRVTHITAEEFDEVVLKSKTPVLVDFWAEWCGPCKMLTHVLDQISMERDDLKVVKYNIDQEGDVKDRFGVRAVPTCLVFNEGVIAGTKIGAVSHQQMNAFLNTIL